MTRVRWTEGKGVWHTINHCFRNEKEAAAYARLLEESGLVTKTLLTE